MVPTRLMLTIWTITEEPRHRNPFLLARRDNSSCRAWFNTCVTGVRVAQVPANTLCPVILIANLDVRPIGLKQAKD